MTGNNNSKKSDNKKNKKGGSRRGRTGGILVSPFPSLRLARTRYTDTFTLIESAVGVGAYSVFAPNSLYDPNTSGTGHQPMFYDQLASGNGPYLRYRSLSTRARITISNYGSGPIYGGWYIQAGGVGPASLATCMEKPWSKWTSLSGTAGSKCVTTFNVSIPHHKAFGISPAHMKTDDYYAGDWNASPLRVFSFVIWVNSQLATVASAIVTVELDTLSEFFGLTNTPTS